MRFLLLSFTDYITHDNVIEFKIVMKKDSGKLMIINILCYELMGVDF